MVADVQISGLTTNPSPAFSDLFALDTAGGVTYKESASQLLTLFSTALLPLSGGTMTGAIVNYTANPTNSLELVPKSYVDAISSGFQFKAPVYASTTTNLVGTYNNGASGVGATFTVTATGAFTTDGQTPPVNSRILIAFQSSTFQNGLYVLTIAGTTGVSPVFTRTTDFDNTPSGEIAPGDYIIVENGTLYGGSTWVQTATVTTIGTDAITFSELNFKVAQGNGITITNNVISANINSTNLKFTTSAINTIQDIATGSSVQFGNLGIGRAATFDFDLSKSSSGTFVAANIQNRSSSASSVATLLIQTSNGDAYTNYVANTTNWCTGIDISDSAKYKISASGNLGTTDVLAVDTSGTFTFTGSIGINSTPAGTTALLISSSLRFAEFITGTLAASGVDHIGFILNNISTPTTSFNSYGIEVDTVFTAPSGGTLPTAACINLAPTTAGVSGTVTTLLGIQIGAGTFNAGTNTNVFGIRVNALAGGTNRYGGYFLAPTGGTIAIALRADNLSVGYNVTPPSSGAIISGKFGVGTSSVNSLTAAQINTTGAYNTYLTGTQTADDGSTVASLVMSSVLAPASNGVVTWGAYLLPTFQAAGGQTISGASTIWATASASGNSGTITSLYTIKIDTGTAGGTITDGYGIFTRSLAYGTNRYGGYFEKPSAGTVSLALYTEGLSSGYKVTAPTNGVIIAGNTSIGSSSTTSLFNVGSANQFQIDTNGNAAFNGIVAGARFAISSSTTGTSGNIYQIYAAGSLGASSGTVGTASYIYLYPNYGSNVGTISVACGLLVDAGNSTGTITLGVGVKILPIAWGTTRYAIYADAPTGGVTNYGAFIGGATGLNVGPSIDTTLTIAGLGSAGLQYVSFTGTVSKTGTTLYGVNCAPTVNPSSNSYNGYGLSLYPGFNSGAGGINATISAAIGQTLNGSGTITEARILAVDTGTASGVTVNTAYSLKVEPLAFGTTRIGLYVATPAGGTNICGAFLGYPVNIGDGIQYEASKITCYINRNTHTSASSDTYQCYIAGSMGATTSNTIGRSCTLFLNPDLSANAGTVSDAFGILIGTGNTAATVTRGFGLYITAIAYGTTRTGLRIDVPTGGTSNICASFGGNTAFFSTTGSFGSGTGVISISNASVNPSTNPSGGFVFYGDSGAAKIRGSSGTTTTIAPAEPHCPCCGSDFGLEWENEEYGGNLQVCIKCLVGELGQKEYIRWKRAA